MKYILRTILSVFLSIAIVINIMPYANAATIENYNNIDIDFKMVNEQGHILPAKVIEYNYDNLPEDVLFEVIFEVEVPQRVSNNAFINSISPKMITVVTGTMSVSKARDLWYTCTYTYKASSLNGDYITVLDVGIYKDYPSMLISETFYPNSAVVTKSTELYYATPGTYTLKIIAQVTTAYCGLIGTPFNAGTRKIIVL